MPDSNNGGANPQGGAGAPAPANPNPATPAPAGGAPAGGEGGNGGGASDETSKLKAEIARLGGLVNGYAENEKKRQQEIDKQKEDDAKKNGEMEKLYTETKTNFEKISGEHTTAQASLKMYEEHFGQVVDQSLASLDKETKTAIEPFLAPLANNFEKAKALPGILAILKKGAPVGATPANGGAPAGVNSYDEAVKKGDKKGAIRALVGA